MSDNRNLDDRLNKIQSNYPLHHLIEESTYVLEEDTSTENRYLIIKKPDECSLVLLPNWSAVINFLTDKEEVLVLRASGTYSRYNYGVELFDDNSDNEDDITIARINTARIGKSSVK